MDLLELPVEVIGVLDLLEIRHGHSSGVGKEVRQYNYTLVEENEVGFGSSRTVCQFAAYPAFKMFRVVGANDIFESCREKDRHRKPEKVLVAYIFGFREALDPLRF